MTVISRVALAAVGGALAMALTACGGTGLSTPSPVLTLPATSAASDPRVGVSVIEPADRGEPLNLQGTTADGASIDTSSMLGHPVVLNAWASWCTTCKDEEPYLLGAYDNLHPDGVSFVGLNVNDDPQARSPYPYPSIVDRNGSLLATIPGVPPSALPSTVILDSQGRVAVRVIGALQAGQLEQLLSQVD